MKSSKKVELKGRRINILGIIDRNRNSEEFFLKVKPSVSIFVYLLNNTKIKKLYFLPSIKKTIPKKVLDALRKSGVKMIVSYSRVGRPLKINERKFRKISRRKRISVKEKIKILGISRRAYYYWKKKLL